MLCATCALMGAICTLHFTALLGDAIVIGGSPLPADTSGLFAGGSSSLAVLMAGMNGLLLLAAFINALADRKLALMSQKQA
jgi:hypothetical protein